MSITCVELMMQILRNLLTSKSKWKSSDNALNICDIIDVNESDEAKKKILIALSPQKKERKKERKGKEKKKRKEKKRKEKNGSVD